MANLLNQLEMCGGRGEDQKFNFRMEGESLQKVFISTNLIDDLDQVNFLKLFYWNSDLTKKVRKDSPVSKKNIFRCRSIIESCISRNQELGKYCQEMRNVRDCIGFRKTNVMKPFSKFGPQMKRNFEISNEVEELLSKGATAFPKIWETETSNKFEAIESVYTLRAIQTGGFALFQRTNIRKERQVRKFDLKDGYFCVIGNVWKFIFLCCR